MSIDLLKAYSLRDGRSAKAIIAPDGFLYGWLDSGGQLGRAKWTAHGAYVPANNGGSLDRAGPPGTWGYFMGQDLVQPPYAVQVVRKPAPTSAPSLEPGRVLEGKGFFTDRSGRLFFYDADGRLIEAVSTD